MAIHVQVVEFIPDPDRVEVRIEIDDYIAEHIGDARISGEVSELLGGIGDHQDVTIWQHGEVVTEEQEREVEVRRRKFCIQIRHGKLAHRIPYEIEFAQYIGRGGRRRCGDRVCGIWRDQTHKVTVGEELYRIDQVCGLLNLGWCID